MIAEARQVIDELDTPGPSTRSLRVFRSRYGLGGVQLLSKKKQYDFVRHANALRIQAARESFWEFCKVLHSDFYLESRWHLRLLCEVLQALYEKRLPLEKGEPARKLMINMPPRHGKSRTLILFCAWVLGKNPRERIIACSYNDALATDFSRYTRDEISRKKNFSIDIAYKDIFPKSVIKHGDASYTRWALEGQHFNYLGAGVGSGITGKGCTIGIVDDPIKDAEEAFSEATLAKKWQWYADTFSSRQESGKNDDAIEIINHTRWAEKDICGRILSCEDASDWFVFLLEAKSDTGEMLCPDLLSEKAYVSLKRKMSPEIFFANYHQKPITIAGRLYSHFEVYDPSCISAPEMASAKRIAYLDTADTGSDYLAGFVAVELGESLAVIDAIYTQAPMEMTEPMTARMLAENKVNHAIIESNNGGRGFARNVQRIIGERYPEARIAIAWRHQTHNKHARIYANSAYVQQKVRFPVGWSVRWPELYSALMGYQREGKNSHDDAPDALTGLAEMYIKNTSLAQIIAVPAIM